MTLTEHNGGAQAQDISRDNLASYATLYKIFQVFFRQLQLSIYYIIVIYTFEILGFRTVSRIFGILLDSKFSRWIWVRRGQNNI